jgi:hypothetical protein
VQSVSNREISADIKAKAVSAFANMLSEIRAYGEGLIISDQSPEKLAPDAIRNTNLQIAHQLRDRNDREAIARAMIMTTEQQDYLGKLQIGEAAYFRTGLEKATFITIPEYKDSAGFLSIPSDNDVLKKMLQFREQLKTKILPFDGCRFCTSPCNYREAIEPIMVDKKIRDSFKEALMGFEKNPEPEHWPANWDQLAKACKTATQTTRYLDHLDAAYCYLSHQIDFPFTQHMRDSFEQAYSRLTRG